MVAYAILFIVLPLAFAWLVGVTACLPPYSLPPTRKPEPEIEPEFEEEVRAFLAQHGRRSGERPITAIPLPSAVPRRRAKLSASRCGACCVMPRRVPWHARHHAPGVGGVTQRRSFPVHSGSTAAQPFLAQWEDRRCLPWPNYSSKICAIWLPTNACFFCDARALTGVPSLWPQVA
jgi:hypothetical protein